MTRIAILLLSILLTPSNAAWPPATREARPWSYWWWMGSAVDPANLTRELEALRKAGWGGVHLIPIYGAKGYESRYIDYLSPRWMEMLRHTVTEAERLDLGVDMTTGTGWNFGGPTITRELANARMEKLKFAPSARTPVEVERAAPGGEGYMLNPFYGPAIRTYLERFDEAFKNYSGPKPRAMYHDSFEYEANWAPDLLAQFEKRRGYRLQDHEAAFFGGAQSDEAARVKADYRETLSDLMLEEFTRPWVEWSHAHGFATRNQAHGSPANLLDLYAAADIPETEMFNRDRSVVVSKFASSAAHVTGKRLVAAETGTWLKEHFNVTLADLKELVDQLFLAGVNHVVYHGTAYSPADAPWPGWLFYASTQMNSRNAIWRDAPALNAYVSRAQSMLQHGRADSDLLVYWPVHDAWHDARGVEINMTVHRRAWVEEQRFGKVAERLLQRGYSFDFISDRQVQAGKLPAHRALLVPRTEHMPVETLAALAKAGTRVLFEEALPADVPGLGRLAERRAQFDRIKREMKGAAVGPLETLLASAGIRRESLVDRPGLAYVRRTAEAGSFYLLANRGTLAFDGWLPLNAPARSAVILDPMTGAEGIAAMRGATEVYMQLAPGETRFVRLSQRKQQGATWIYRSAGEEAIPLKGVWKVEFIDGGPELPRAYTTERLSTWTTENFAGTARYSLTFDGPRSGEWLLELGRVAESAHITLNGRDLGVVFAPPFRVLADGLKPGANRLEIEVTNLSANRIRDLDLRRVNWRIFRDINFVNIDYKPFDASVWPVRDSGLLGPVVLRRAAPAMIH